MKLGHTIEDSKKKYPELSDELLDILEEWTQKRGLIGVPREQLALFAQSCYFNKDAILRCMDTYYKMRSTVPEFFGNRDPELENLRHSLKVLEFTAFPVPDPNGNVIIFHRLSDTKPSKYMFNDGIKLLLMTMDASLYTEGCMPGYIFLFDMNGVSMGHLMRLSVNSIRKFFEYIQEANPVRLKAIHIVNTVWFIDKILALAKPFMKSELLEILHFHTGDISDIYEHIPLKCLPKDYGGELDYISVLHEAHCRKLVQLKDYFLEEEKINENYKISRKYSN